MAVWNWLKVTCRPWMTMAVFNQEVTGVLFSWLLWVFQEFRPGEPKPTWVYTFAMFAFCSMWTEAFIWYPHWASLRHSMRFHQVPLFFDKCSMAKNMRKYDDLKELVLELAREEPFNRRRLMKLVSTRLPLCYPPVQACSHVVFLATSVIPWPLANGDFRWDLRWSDKL